MIDDDQPSYFFALGRLWHQVIFLFFDFNSLLIIGKRLIFLILSTSSKMLHIFINNKITLIELLLLLLSSLLFVCTINTLLGNNFNINMKISSSSTIWPTLPFYCFHALALRSYFPRCNL